jgi:hypothetical protein
MDAKKDFIQERKCNSELEGTILNGHTEQKQTPLPSYFSK